jgi:hypothetical protein
MAEPCGAMNRSGNKCMLPGMSNGRCRIHGGQSTGPLNPRVKHGLYRKYMSPEEAEMFDGLKQDENYADMRAEAALLRVLIERCSKAILGESNLESFRVPMQVLPSYMDKLIKVLEKIEPTPGMGSRSELQHSLDDELQQMLREESAIQDDEQLFADGA